LGVNWRTSGLELEYSVNHNLEILGATYIGGFYFYFLIKSLQHKYDLYCIVLLQWGNGP